MKKTRSDAKWNGLSHSQQQKLEAWLFEENLRYDDALDRAKKELGFTGSKASVQRFYKNKAQERLLKEMVDSRQEAVELNEAPVNTATLKGAGLKVLAHRFFQQMRNEGVADTATMAKLLLQSEANELQREERAIQREGLELRRQRLALQRSQWEFVIVNEVNTKLLPELEKYRRESEVASDPYAESKRINKIRARLFGKNLPDQFPESAEEEAAMAAAKEREEAERKREDEERHARWEQQKLEREQAAERERAVQREQSASEPPAWKWEDREPDHFPFNNSKTVAEYLKQK